MRSFWQIFLLILGAAGALYAQVPVPGTVMPVPLPQPYGYSNTVIDRDGNLLVFDVITSYSPAPLTPPSTVPLAGSSTAVAVVRTVPPGVLSMKTRITVGSGDGTRTFTRTSEFDGSFQVVGAGAHAVYAIVTSYVQAATSVTATNRLVALTVIAGVLPSTLPSVDVPLRADVKLSPANDIRLQDVLSIVDAPIPMILMPVTPGAPRPVAPVAQRRMQFVRYSGAGTFEVTDPVQLP